MCSKPLTVGPGSALWRHIYDTGQLAVGKATQAGADHFHRLRPSFWGGPAGQGSGEGARYSALHPLKCSLLSGRCILIGLPQPAGRISASSTSHTKGLQKRLGPSEVVGKEAAPSPRSLVHNISQVVIGNHASSWVA